MSKLKKLIRQVIKEQEASNQQKQSFKPFPELKLPKIPDNVYRIPDQKLWDALPTDIQQTIQVRIEKDRDKQIEKMTSNYETAKSRYEDDLTKTGPRKDVVKGNDPANIVQGSRPQDLPYDKIVNAISDMQPTKLDPKTNDYKTIKTNSIPLNRG